MKLWYNLPVMEGNLYVHFPFCRKKCSYCALHSRAGTSQADRDAYVRRLAERLETEDLGRETWDTIYFGGGSPALCDLTPLFSSLASHPSSPNPEFTVELHPLDVTEALMETLKSGGVNRISMGVQSLDDKTLAHMRRGYTVDEAERAFRLIRKHFDNAGIDLIVGYPGADDPMPENLGRLRDWGLRHCSVYSLILEEKSLLATWIASGKHPELVLPDDDRTMDGLRTVAAFLRELGLERYEISNYAVPGYECRHNLAVWRGEDYVGLGEGAYGRRGLTRTRDGEIVETLSVEKDALERRLFRLRTCEGLDATGRPEWGQTLRTCVREGLLTQEGSVFRLTERGSEVCDSILAELV